MAGYRAVKVSSTVTDDDQDQYYAVYIYDEGSDSAASPNWAAIRCGDYAGAQHVADKMNGVV